VLNHPPTSRLGGPMRLPKALRPRRACHEPSIRIYARGPRHRFASVACQPQLTSNRAGRTKCGFSDPRASSIIPPPNWDDSAPKRARGRRRVHFIPLRRMRGKRRVRPCFALLNVLGLAGAIQ
jgi:hypothetical protein